MGTERWAEGLPCTSTGIWNLPFLYQRLLEVVQFFCTPAVVSDHFWLMPAHQGAGFMLPPGSGPPECGNFAVPVDQHRSVFRLR